MTRIRLIAVSSAALLMIAGTTAALARKVTIDFDGANFSTPTTLTSDYWGLRLGGPTSAVFFSEADDGCEVTESIVVGTTGTGFFDAPYDIDAIVVQDREWVDEECSGDYVLVESTFDWFAQDDDGNVWYMGEDTTSVDDEGNCLSTEGSWKAGEDGGLPGVIMLSEPRPGLGYQQEFLEDVAEDQAKVLRLNARVAIAAGEFADCLLTKESSPLEPGSVEHKYYCPLSEGGVGLTLVNEFGGKTRRVEYVGTALPSGDDFPDEFPTTGVCGEAVHTRG